MKNLNFKSLLAAAVLVFTMGSCASVNRTMKEPNVRVDLVKADFTLSEQVSAEANSTRILGIDWSRLISKNTGMIESQAAMPISLASLPVVGTVLTDKTANYALYELMNAHAGYDVVFYPQYVTTVKKPILGLGFLFRKTTVKATARLGKLK